VLGHSTLAQLVNVNALDGVALASWGESQELAYMRAPCCPQHSHLVPFGDQKLERELLFDTRAQSVHPLAQTLQALAVSWERVVLDVVGASDAVENVHAPLHQDLLVVAS